MIRWVVKRKKNESNNGKGHRAEVPLTVICGEPFSKPPWSSSRNQGFNPLSLREIARRIGVTPAAPYHHFKDRGELLVQIGMQGYGHLLQLWSKQRPLAWWR